jgi:hypothetical protein
MDYPLTGVVLGNGWDSVQSRKTSANCIVGDEFQDEGTTTSVKYTEVTDRSSLMDALKVSASAKISAISGASFSTTVDYAKTTKLSSTGTNIAVRVMTLRGANYIVPVGTQGSIRTALSNRRLGDAMAPPDSQLLQQGSIQLTPRAARLARSNFTQFKRECGDGYVAAVLRGGGMSGIAIAKDTSSEESSSFAAAVKGTYGNVTVAASVAQTAERLASSNRVEINYQLLNGGSKTTAVTLGEFGQLIRSITAADVASNSNSILMEVRPYTELSSYVSAVSLGDMEALASQYYRLETLRETVNSVIADPEAFVFEGRVTLAATQALGTKIESDLVKIEEALEKCLEMPRCVAPTGLKLDDYDYRSELPLSKVLAQPWLDIQNLKSALPAMRATLSGMNPTYNERYCSDRKSGPGFNICVGWSYRTKDNQDYISLNNQINSFDAQISASKATDNVETRYRVYISAPNEQRCSSTTLGRACITGDRLGNYRSTMRAASVAQ